MGSGDAIAADGAEVAAGGARLADGLADFRVLDPQLVDAVGRHGRLRRPHPVVGCGHPAELPTREGSATDGGAVPSPKALMPSSSPTYTDPRCRPRCRRGRRRSPGPPTHRATTGTSRRRPRPGCDHSRSRRSGPCRHDRRRSRWCCPSRRQPTRGGRPSGGRAIGTEALDVVPQVVHDVDRAIGPDRDIERLEELAIVRLRSRQTPVRTRPPT